MLCESAMSHQSEVSSEYVPSTKDRILGTLFLFSGLLGFGLSFTLLHEHGRPILFGVCLLTCTVCITFADNRKGISLGFLAFLLLRAGIALVTRGARFCYEIIASNTGTIAPSDAQYRCFNELFFKPAIAGVGSALGVQPPGSDPVGDVTGALKTASKNPVIAMSAGAMAARLGGSLLTRAGALALGEAITTKFVPIVGGAAATYGTYSAVSDGIEYFNNNVANCHDAK